MSPSIHPRIHPSIFIYHGPYVSCLIRSSRSASTGRVTVLNIAESLVLILAIISLVLLMAATTTVLLAVILMRCNHVLGIVLASNITTAGLIWKLAEHPMVAGNDLFDVRGNADHGSIQQHTNRCTTEAEKEVEGQENQAAKQSGRLSRIRWRGAGQRLKQRIYDMVSARRRNSKTRRNPTPLNTTESTTKSFETSTIPESDVQCLEPSGTDTEHPSGSI
ncbi:hypothetical protein Q9L58_005646 [Maublancomyces gigas]|uniref:Uncharacterized protein n=1 Tax=Discina gigas TaxID=1032678 RepID=A0ABR3GHW2_9PEZI